MRIQAGEQLFSKSGAIFGCQCLGLNGKCCNEVRHSASLDSKFKTERRRYFNTEKLSQLSLLLRFKIAYCKAQAHPSRDLKSPQQILAEKAPCLGVVGGDEAADVSDRYDRRGSGPIRERIFRETARTGLTLPSSSLTSDPFRPPAGCTQRSGVVAQSVRAPACHAGGCGFDSRPSRHLFSEACDPSDRIPLSRTPLSKAGW